MHDSIPRFLLVGWSHTSIGRLRFALFAFVSSKGDAKWGYCDKRHIFCGKIKKYFMFDREKKKTPVKNVPYLRIMSQI